MKGCETMKNDSSRLYVKGLRKRVLKKFQLTFADWMLRKRGDVRRVRCFQNATKRILRRVCALNADFDVLVFRVDREQISTFFSK